ncbi:hypothetical protein AAF712_009721 [Marasmius tenuissimus]|uniref:F-box domain-containing protein n=1 Tax=Marasmius tenuissimus TaxID=585030 RepID=A0ABR2ZQK7_9AGAR
MASTLGRKADCKNRTILLISFSLKSQNKDLIAHQHKEAAAITALPVEILTIIFTYCAFRPCWPLGAAGKWFHFSHVCRRWRDVALDAPGVWACPDFECPVWALQMLERSKAASLDLTWRYGSAEGNKAFYKSLGQIDRVVGLRITAPLKEHIFTLVIDRLVKPAPRLRSLHLTSHSPTAEVLFLPTFLGGHSPLLTDLIVDGPFISWDSSLWRNNLSVLKVNYSAGGLNHASSNFSHFLLALTHMPNLKELDLHRSMPSCPVLPSKDPIVPLRCLRSLRLSNASVADISYFFDHIHFPALPLHLDLYGIEVPSHTSVHEQIIPSLQRAFPSINGNLFNFLYVANADFEAWACTCCNISECFARCHSKHAFVRVHFATDYPDVTSFENVIRSLPLGGVCSLWLQAHTIGHQFEMVVYKKLQNLTALKITGSAAAEVTKALWEMAPDTSEEIFPRLYAVEMHTVHFDELLFLGLQSWLRQRIGYCRGIQIMVLRHCIIEQEKLTQIRTLIEVDNGFPDSL